MFELADSRYGPDDASPRWRRGSRVTFGNRHGSTRKNSAFPRMVYPRLSAHDGVDHPSRISQPILGDSALHRDRRSTGSCPRSFDRGTATYRFLFRLLRCWRVAPCRHGSVLARACCARLPGAGAISVTHVAAVSRQPRTRLRFVRKGFHRDVRGCRLHQLGLAESSWCALKKTALYCPYGKRG
jgi:hypothetical protein